VSISTRDRRPTLPTRSVAAPPRRGPRLAQRLIPYGYLSPTVVLMVVLMLTPIVLVITYSVMDSVITSDESRFIGFDNYAQVLTDTVFFTAVRNTIYFSLVSVVGHFVIGLTFATLLNTRLLSARTKALFRVIYIVPWVFTAAIIAVLWRLLLNPNGIVNYLLSTVGLADSGTEWLSNPDVALHAVTFMNLWAGYPFFMVSLLAGLQGIPQDLYEAARVDGASWVRQFWHVTLPQLKPIIISMALLDFIWTTHQFALIWLTTGGGPVVATEMLSTYIYKLAFSRYEFALASASAVLVLLVSLALAVLYVRHQKARD
jgi:multiple sugar transport system permease protein